MKHLPQRPSFSAALRFLFQLVSVLAWVFVKVNRNGLFGNGCLSIGSFRLQPSEFTLVEQIVRKLPVQFGQDELSLLVIVRSQSRHGEQQFREWLEKMPSLGRQFEFPQSFFAIRVGTSGLNIQRTAAGLVPKK